MKDEGKHAAAPTGHAPSPATGGQIPSSFIPHPSSFSPSSGYTTRALPDLVRTDDVSFATPPRFNIAAVGIVAILIALYATFW